MNDNMTDAPDFQINAAKRPNGLRACADGLNANPDKEFAQKCMRYAADRIEQLERERNEARLERDQLREALDIRREIQTRP